MSVGLLFGRKQGRGIKREHGSLSLLQFVYDSVSRISLLHLQNDLLYVFLGLAQDRVLSHNLRLRSHSLERTDSPKLCNTDSPSLLSNLFILL